MLTFIVRDRPQPEGSKSPFAARKAGAFTGRAHVVDDNRPALVNWRGSVRTEAQKAVDADPGRYPLEGPVVIAVTFTKPLTSGLAKRMQHLHWPYKKPDLDKYLRAVLDALQAAGIFKDDAQVVEVLRLAKHFVRGDALPILTDAPADYMLGLRGTYQDVLTTPGAVIRVAHVTEFGGVLVDLASLDLTAGMVLGGR